MNVGKIKRVIGPVVDVEFTEKLPEILSALKIDHTEGNKHLKVTLEVFP